MSWITLTTTSVRRKRDPTAHARVWALLVNRDDETRGWARRRLEERGAAHGGNTHPARRCSLHHLSLSAGHGGSPCRIKEETRPGIRLGMAALGYG
jgi:hypothetical protein